jgi:two-component system LytT family response regulator
LINEFKPELVFLDVQMPGMTGFEVLQHLDELPAIIFSTAYDQYALRAFEVHAIDYLLKPYTRERFDEAIRRLTPANTQHLAPLADNLLMEEREYPDRFLVEHRQRFITLQVADIQHITAEGDYSRLHTQQEHYLSNHGITALEKKLNPASFMRIHRSGIINLDAVAEIQRYGKGYVITLKNGEKTNVSRGYADRIRDLMV